MTEKDKPPLLISQKCQQPTTRDVMPKALLTLHPEPKVTKSSPDRERVPPELLSEAEHIRANGY